MNTVKNYSHYYPFAIKLDRCVGSCNTINDLSNKVCVPNKPEDLNLSLFNMIIGISESKALTKHVSYKCICRSDGRNCKSDQRWNIDKYQYECKKSHYLKKIVFGTLPYVTVENIQQLLWMTQLLFVMKL